jgi:hypothetical protein
MVVTTRGFAHVGTAISSANKRSNGFTVGVSSLCNVIALAGKCNNIAIIAQGLERVLKNDE